MQQHVQNKEKKLGAGAVEKVIETIKDWIANGTYRKGDKLPSEAELIALIGVSRGSVREGTKILSALGLIEIKRGNGTYVTGSIDAGLSASAGQQLSGELIGSHYSFRQLVEARDAIERAILSLAVQHVQQENLQLLEEYNQQTLQGYEEDRTLESLIQLEVQFHQQLGRCSENRLLSDIYNQILQLCTPHIIQNFHLTAAQGYISYFIHQRMVDAIRYKDCDMALNAVTDATKEFAKDKE